MNTTVYEDVKLLDRGVLTIPAGFREELNFNPGGFVRITKDKWRLIIEPVRTLAYSARSYTDNDLKDFFELDDQESKKLKKNSVL